MAMRLTPDIKYLVIAPDGPGSKGDEAMLTGCLSLLGGDHVALITPRNAFWKDVLVGRTCLFDELYIPLEEIADQITFPLKLVVVGADTLDGSCGLEASLCRLRAVQAAVDAGGEAWVFCSMRSDVPPEICQTLRGLSEQVHFFLRDEVSMRNFCQIMGKGGSYFPDFAFFCKPLLMPRAQNLKREIVSARGNRPVVGLEMSETMFRSFHTEITDENRKLFAQFVVERVLQAVPEAFVVFLCHDTRSWSEHWSDAQYAQVAYNYLVQKGYGLRAAIQPANFTHVELLDFINVCDVLVCGRMHMSITAYRAGVLPVIVTGTGKNYIMVEKVKGMCLNRLGTAEFQLHSLEELDEKLNEFFQHKDHWNRQLAEKNQSNGQKDAEYGEWFRKSLRVKPMAAADHSELLLDEACSCMERSAQLQGELARLEQENRELAGMNQELMARLEQENRELAGMNQELTKRKQDLENAIAQYANQEQQLREKLKDAETGNEALLLQNYEKDTKIFNQTNRINELESWEVIWRQRSNTLDQVYASRTWRYTHKIVTILRKLFPAGSWQSKLVGSILRVPLRFEHWVRDKIHQKKLEKQRRQYFQNLGVLCFPQTDKPLVSIVIPVYNQFDYTLRCLESILRTCEGLDYEVILADDCSTDETRRISEKVQGIHVVRNETNLRFLRNCNHAAESARGDYILFLNNDTVVHENWLQSLLSLMEENPKCGMAGSKLIFADGRLQEAGGIVWNDGSAWNYGRLQDPENSEFNYVKEVDYISGCSIMIRAQLWKQLGGFDERFAPAYCEDSDLAFQVRAAGYQVLYQPLSVVTHYEGVSNGTDVASGQKQYQIVNKKKLFEKWKNVLQKEHFKEGENVFRARERSAKKPCLLMVDHYVPTYDQDAGSRTVFEYLKLFVKMGYDVKFIPDNFNRSEPYTTTLQQMGIEVLYGPWYAQHWKEWVLENARQIEYVFLNRPHISVKYIDFLRQVTSARIIYYGHDLHFLREERQYEITKDPALLESSAKWRAIELSLMRKADMAYYPSSIEEAYIHNISPDIRVKAIPAYIYTDVETPEYKLSRRKDLMFIGGFGHTPNVDAVEWLAKEIWPLVRAERKDICVHILGSHPPKEIEAMNAPDFQVHGFVSDEELNQFYAECRMSIVPLRYGAGIKGKVVEAMKNGIPVVTTSVGSEGITGCEEFLAVCDDAEAFARKILDLYEDEQDLSRMSELECAYIRDHFSPENAMNTIKEDFS